MPLSNGTCLGPYEIQAAIGAGGMGEVYKARDTRLDRTVAIKVLPAELSADPDRRVRFEREARAIAALSHPHICTLYDIGTHPSTGSGQATLYLVMEHLGGETLAERLLKGPLPLDQALGVATEIADALAAAHRQGIIHRDLKPGNVMLTKAGAKLLDFGLAKLAGHGAEPAVAQLASVATRSAPLTTEGTIVGTLQYMAPEQVEGKPVDARTDLWALGAILYEMLTGKRAFEGTSSASLIANIMNAEPAGLATLHPLTPPALDRVVTKCLAKRPDDRWESSHDLADELRWILRERLAEAPLAGPASPAGDRSRWSVRPVLRSAVFGGSLAVAGILGAAGGWLAGRTPPSPSSTVTRSVIPVAPADRLEGDPGSFGATAAGTRTSLAISPDGSRLAFVGRSEHGSRLYVRLLAGAAALELRGTEGAETPRFSPDGRWIAFWAGGSLMKIPAEGGPVTPICTVDSSRAPFGISWGDDGHIVYGLLRGGLMRVSAEGGTPSALTRLDPGEISHQLPHVMPGGKTVLFTARSHAWLWGSEQVLAVSTETGVRKAVMVGGADVRVAATGHLLYVRLGTLMARAFDSRTLAVSGQPVALVDDVAQAVEGAEGDASGGAHYDVSRTGTLIYASGKIAPIARRELVVVDMAGRATRPPVEPSTFLPGIALSPDGAIAAAVTRDTTRFSLWLIDLKRGAKTPILSEGEMFWPKWTPDGRRVAFMCRAGGSMSIDLVAVDGAGQPERLVSGHASGSFTPNSWHPDGSVLAVAVLQPNGKRDIAVLRMRERDNGLQPFVQSVGNDINAAFSPDGKWLAYSSDETGRPEIYLQGYPAAGQKTAVSTAGGVHPVWHPGSKRLYFVSTPDGEQRRWMMTAELAFQPRVGASEPRRLFEVKFVPPWPGTGISLYPSGDRFLVFLPLPVPPAAPVTAINLVDHWFEELKAKVPAGGAK